MYSCCFDGYPPLPAIHCMAHHFCCLLYFVKPLLVFLKVSKTRVYDSWYTPLADLT